MLPHYLKYLLVRNYYEQIRYRVKSSVYTPVGELSARVATTKEPVKFADKDKLDYRQIRRGESWGTLFECAWFNFTGQVPCTAKGKDVVLMLDLNGEGLIVDEQGSPLRGITNVSSSFDSSIDTPGKRIVWFKQNCQGTENVDIWVDASNNDLFGAYCKNGTLEQAEIAVVSNAARNLYYDLEVISSLIKTLDARSARYCSIFGQLHNVACALKNYTDEEFIAAREYTGYVLNKKNGDVDLTFYAVGHSHLDLAWLWPLRETKRKAARTFSTQLELLERYPEYIYGASQPQMFDWIKQEHPNLYQKIKQKVVDGKIECQGGMWVESDTNVPCGESLIRQFIYGKGFFKEEMGKDVKQLWLPDVFGYSGALPQIIKKCECDYFMTMKLSWNDYNSFPYHSFNWRGIDGTSVVSHMLPNGNYNSNITCVDLVNAERNYMDANVCDKALILYGIGDGGGGCSPQHLERISRELDLNGVPKVKNAASFEFFEELNKIKSRLPDYCGELYLERHQGTLTSGAKSKNYNRRLEYALLNYEYLLCMALVYKQPSDLARLHEIWKETLLYQFHDILPGTSIKRVYSESEERYALLLEELNKKISETAQSLCGKSAETVVNFNSVSVVDYQKIDDEVMCVEISPYSGELKLKEKCNKIIADDYAFSNGIIEVEFNENGAVTSIKNLISGFEAINGTGNNLKVFYDKGDAWDISPVYREIEPEVFKLKSFSIEKNEECVTRFQTFEYGKSSLVQRVKLYANSETLEFENVCNWGEDEKFLRVEFNSSINPSKAVYDIQYGKIERSTTVNNSLEYAATECCGQKYALYTNGQDTIALLNDSKYGYFMKNGLMSLGLLRSQNYPCQCQDKGTQSFKYALMVCGYEPYHNKIDNEAVRINNPLVTIPAKLGKQLFEISSPNVRIGAIKPANSKTAVVLRIYESAGFKAATEVKINFDYKEVYYSTMLENYESDALVKDKILYIKVEPFEIKTIVFEV